MKYQVYLNGNWIADCDTFEEAETIANGNASNGNVDIYPPEPTEK